MTLGAPTLGGWRGSIGRRNALHSRPSTATARSIRLGSWIVAAVAVVVFLNTLGHDFAYDDVHIIQENETIQSLGGLSSAIRGPYWPSELGRALGLWRPLSTALYGLEWALWGDRPAAFHATNVLLHGVASVLVFRLLLTLLPFVGALAGALVFAVHPVHVEAVANVVGRAEVLSSVFYLTACLLFLRWRESLGMVRTLGLCALYAAAFATKESAVTLPGVLFLLDGVHEDRTLRDLPKYLRERWLMYGGLAATAALILIGRHAVLGSLARALAPYGAEALEHMPRIWTVAGIWTHYVRLLVFPLDLSVDYAPAVVRIYYGWGATNALGAGLVLTILLLALWSWRARPRDPGMPAPRVFGFGVVWFVITISTIANVAFLSGVLLAERTFYLPSVGFAAIVGWFVSSIHVKRPGQAAIFVSLAVVLMATRTVTRNRVWKDNLTVFNSLARDHPESGRAQWALGDVYFERGQVSEALRFYRLAIGIAGSHYSLLTEIGSRLVGVGRFESARPILEMAWRDHPEYATAPSLLAVANAGLADWEGAERTARASLAIDAEDPSMQHVLAASLRELGRWSEAAEARRSAIELGEGDRWQQWYWLAEEEARAGERGAARAALDTARVLADSPEALDRVDSLAVALGLR
jgi:Tfp pilus assembly protein PilF